ncbi:hypothetical protein P167DRAFT_561931 [Morchella conica CCBAS932]|uniref:t-SNARE coiled-coil homology domain-containing protein n=1 Tax=Morchella conica CCBAS932 TaxID=1392247 RepID=A0A3N4L2D4_9PEZI|nr:hypothetical protein P167DRAFT_561931 [Morchella conica CCBAS932]
MTDITPIINECLSKHPTVALISTSRKPTPPTDEFLKEAFRIESHISSLRTYLLSIRQSYLSTATASARPNLPRTISTSSISSNSANTLTDAQRDSIDAETKRVVQELLTLIDRLESTETLRAQTADALLRRRFTTGLRGLFRDESVEQKREEGKLETLKQHREGVLWFLKTKLAKASEIQRGQQEIRLQRQVEKGKSMLNKAPPQQLTSNFGSSSNLGGGRNVAIMEEEEKKSIEAQLTPEQLQLFEKENDELIKHYEDALDQVRTAEKSLIEISSLQTQLATNLATQNAYIDNLVQDAMQTTENVERGNKELKKAGEKITIARTAFWGAVVFSGVVFVWDWFI